jgi:hypothetical protein
MSAQDLLNILLSFPHDTIDKDYIKYIYDKFIIERNTNSIINNTENNTENNTKHWLLRIGDGNNFKNSIQHNIWGLKEINSKSFIKEVKENDVLWFIPTNSNGLLAYVAEYKCSYKENDANNTYDINNLWHKYADYSDTWNIIIEYKNLKNISNRNILSNIKGNSTLRRYVHGKTVEIDLYNLFNNINSL